jgi:hypothetical protein
MYSRMCSKGVLLEYARVSRGLAVILALLVMGERPAAAYTDPGSGALLWQLLVAGFVGAMFYLRKAIAWFRSRHPHEDGAD